MPASNVISIIVVTDEHYIVLLAALIKSIETTHKTSEKIHLYIIADGVKTKSKTKLKNSIDSNMIDLSWISMKDAITPEVSLPIDHSSFPLNIYMRLFIPNIVAPGTQKALYLDVDMIVLEDISKVWKINLGDKIIAAVQDPRLLTFSNSWGGVANYKELGFPADTKYFNTGLLLIDIPRWVALNITQRTIDCVANNKKYANYPDQYALNIVLANQWLELDSRWNCFASENIKNPFLIHFISRKPIYKSYTHNTAYKLLFNHYLNLTLWHNFKPISELNRYVKKLKNIAFKIQRRLIYNTL
ncbi:glycosyltransferase family 8 protein [Mucilaginibacter sp.]|uniref:glycosyltransferase family 8 protein n=1 Tax=Mucilaginibacter sp. TaxID=1882438 RepID=UPI003D097051